MKRLTLALAALTLGLTQAHAANYKIDPDHSTVMFKVRHLIGKVTGRFDRFTGTFVYEKDKPKAWKAETTIEAASINTNTAKRDEHLRSEDFFDVKNYPTLKFVSTGVSDIQGNKFKLNGKLTIHGVTKTVALDTEFLGEGKDPFGNEQADFEARVKINRKDYGLTWNQAVETGGALVGDDVEIELAISGYKQK